MFYDSGNIHIMNWIKETISFFPSVDPSTPNESEANTSGVASSNIPITDEEHEALVKYIPQDNEWPDEEHDAAITRLTRGLSILSELPFAGPFAYPVDVQAYPDYWSVVADPVDLSTIVDRLINKYYRYTREMCVGVGVGVGMVGCTSTEYIHFSNIYTSQIYTLLKYIHFSNR